MKRNSNLLILIMALVLVLLVLISIAVRLSRDAGTDPTVPSTTPTGAPETTGPTETAPTEPEPTESTIPPTQVPTEPTAPPPTLAPTEPRGEYIGTLYTRDQLMAMDNTSNGWGPGRWDPGVRSEWAEYAQKQYGKYGSNFIGPDDGNIYLTFDCGYEYTATDTDGSKYRVTERILDVLKEKDVKAVFFVTMYYVKDQPDLVQRMIDEGHVVGNHTNNHPVMTEQSIDTLVYEIMSLHDYVKERFGYEMWLLRPPTGAYSTRTLALTHSLGYKTVHWSFAYADYDTAKQPDVAQSLDLVTRCHHSGAIYLLHAISSTNASLLPDAIDFFRNEGYTLALFQ